MTLGQARNAVHPLGFTIKKTDGGDYVLKRKGAPVDSPDSYFTDDLEDAVGTAKALVARIPGAQTPAFMTLRIVSHRPFEVAGSWYASPSDQSKIAYAEKLIQEYRAAEPDRDWQLETRGTHKDWHRFGGDVLGSNPGYSFLNTPEDMQWLREVHLPQLPPEYQSAILYGNEDSPDRVEVYMASDPRIGDPNLKFVLDEETRTLKQASGWPVGSNPGPADFQSAVERQLEGIENVSPGVTSFCETCQRDLGLSEKEIEEQWEAGGLDDEGGFSWSPCESCGSTLGGNRYSAHGWMKLKGKDTLVHLEICEDCLTYLANGDLPEHWQASRYDKNPSSNPGGRSLDAFTRAYITAALWSTMDESTESGGEPMDKNYTIKDIAPETLARMAADAAQFQSANWDLIHYDLEQAGHDFWLTRNGHGAGFWDGDWPEPAATQLTDAAHAYGEFDLYVGDDGMIHAMQSDVAANNPPIGELIDPEVLEIVERIGGEKKRRGFVAGRKALSQDEFDAVEAERMRLSLILGSMTTEQRRQDRSGLYEAFERLARALDLH
jgi:hypothetical protein